MLTVQEAPAVRQWLVGAAAIGVLFHHSVDVFSNLEKTEFICGMNNKQEKQNKHDKVNGMPMPHISSISKPEFVKYFSTLNMYLNIYSWKGWKKYAQQYCKQKIKLKHKRKDKVKKTRYFKNL